MWWWGGGRCRCARSRATGCPLVVVGEGVRGRARRQVVGVVEAGECLRVVDRRSGLAGGGGACGGGTAWGWGWWGFVLRRLGVWVLCRALLVWCTRAGRVVWFLVDCGAPPTTPVGPQGPTHAHHQHHPRPAHATTPDARGAPPPPNTSPTAAPARGRRPPTTARRRKTTLPSRPPGSHLGRVVMVVWVHRLRVVPWHRWVRG